MNNHLVNALIRLVIVEHYNSDKKVPGFLKIKLSDKFKKDLVKTFKELGYDCARGMIKIEMNIPLK